MHCRRPQDLSRFARHDATEARQTWGAATSDALSKRYSAGSTELKRIKGGCGFGWFGFKNATWLLFQWQMWQTTKNVSRSFWAPRPSFCEEVQMIQGTRVGWRGVIAFVAYPEPGIVEWRHSCVHFCKTTKEVQLSMCWIGEGREHARAAEMGDELVGKTTTTAIDCYTPTTSQLLYTPTTSTSARPVTVTTVLGRPGRVRLALCSRPRPWPTTRNSRPRSVRPGAGLMGRAPGDHQA